MTHHLWYQRMFIGEVHTVTMYGMLPRLAAIQHMQITADGPNGASKPTEAPGGTAVGFKLFPEHMRRSAKHLEVAERVLQDPRIKKVVLVRENRLAVAVSKLRAASTGMLTNLYAVGPNYSGWESFLGADGYIFSGV